MRQGKQLVKMTAWPRSWHSTAPSHISTHYTTPLLTTSCRARQTATEDVSHLDKDLDTSPSHITACYTANTTPDHLVMWGKADSQWRHLSLWHYITSPHITEHTTSHYAEPDHLMWGNADIQMKTSIILKQHYLTPHYCAHHITLRQTRPPYSYKENSKWRHQLLSHYTMSNTPSPHTINYTIPHHTKSCETRWTVSEDTSYLN